MKRISIPSLFCFLITLVTLFSACSERAFKRGNAYYSQREFAKAIPYYEKALKRKKRPEAQLKLAKCYRENYDLIKAEGLYAKIVKEDTVNVGAKYNYAEVLRLNNKCVEATKWYHSYQSDCKIKVDSSESFCAAEKKANNKDYKATVKLIDVQKEPAFGALRYENGFIFLSPQADAGKSKGNTDLYYASYGKDKKVNQVQALSDELNSPYQEGPATLTKEQNEIYFTYEKDGVQGILHASRKNGIWSKPEPFVFNNPVYSVAHPSLSADGQYLYFSSDMPGGYGGYDIYVCKKEGNVWGKPRNVGALINAPGNEFYPHINSDGENNKLYFTSDKQGGIGERDMYFAEVLGDTYSNITLLPAPLNSYYNDYGISFDADGQKGFITSDRPKKGGHSDALYEVNLMPRIYVKGKAMNQDTSVPLSNIIIELTQKGALAKRVTITDSVGNYGFEVELNQVYTVKAKTNGFYSNEISFNTLKKRKPETMEMDIPLQSMKMEPIVEQKAIVLKNIYYDYNKADLQDKAMPELARLLKIMQDNPEISIELSSHTDARGRSEYNQELSQLRAASVVNFLLKAGISDKRVLAKGYGEDKLLNKCKDGVTCSEEEHAKNRRTEFKVIEVKK